MVKKKLPLKMMATPCWMCKFRYESFGNKRCGPCVEDNFKYFFMDKDKE